MRKVAGRLRLDLAQYRELEAFAQFGSELDPDTQKSLARGERLVEMLNQPENDPWPMEDQVVAIFAGTQGFLDRLRTDRAAEFQAELRIRMHAEHDELLRRIRETGQLSDEDEETLRKAIEQFLSDFGPDLDEEGQPLEGAEPVRAGARERERTDELESAVEEAKSAEAEAEEEAEKVEA
jgi:F-type H+-transporting ATPase subunit alpha